MDEIEVTSVLKRYCDKKVERVIKSLLFTQCHFNHKFKVPAKRKNWDKSSSQKNRSIEIKNVYTGNDFEW